MSVHTSPIGAKDPELAIGRFDHISVALANGDALVLGGSGGDYGPREIMLVERYVAKENRFVPLGNLDMGTGPRAVLELADGQVWVLGEHKTVLLRWLVVRP